MEGTRVKVKTLFVGTVEEAAAEVKRMRESGMTVSAEVTIVVEMPNYSRVRERTKTKAAAVRRTTKAVKALLGQPADGVEVVSG